MIVLKRYPVSVVIVTCGLYRYDNSQRTMKKRFKNEYHCMRWIFCRISYFTVRSLAVLRFWCSIVCSCYFKWCSPLHHYIVSISILILNPSKNGRPNQNEIKGESFRRKRYNFTESTFVSACERNNNNIISVVTTNNQRSRY